MEGASEAWILRIIKGILMAVVATLALVLVMSLLLKFVSMGDGVVYAVNQVIKAVSILVGCFVGIRGKLGFLKGAILGIIVMCINYLVFSIISSDWQFGLSNVIDIAIGGVMGLIGGAIKSTLSK